MAIQTNTAPSAFESLVRGQTSSSQNTAPRSDKFASMMDRLISEAATRKRDQVQAESAAQDRRNAAASAADQAAANRDAERKAAERSPPPRPEPIRAEPAKPRQSPDATTQATAQRAAERAAERKDARASDAAKAGDDAHAARTERRETAAANHAAAKEATKDAKAAGAKTARDDTAAQPALADATVRTDTAEEVPPDQTDGAMNDGATQDGAGNQPAEDGNGEAVILDLTVTVTETTVELVTADQSTTLTDIDAALSLAVAPLAIGTPDDEAANTTTEDGAVEATSPGAPTPDDADAPSAAPTAETAADAALAAALATAAAPHQDGKVKVTSDESVKAAAAAKPVAEAPLTMADAVPAPVVPHGGPQDDIPAPHAEAKDAAARDKPAVTTDALSTGALPVADLPNDDSAPLPQSLTELAAAKAKSATRTGADGEAGANAGNRGNQDPSGNAALTQPPAPQAPVADPAKSAGQSAFLAAAAAATDTAPPADGAPHPTTPTHPVFAGIEGVHTAGGVEAGLTTAQLRPSRGSAGLPMGVQDQVAVHISKNVSDGNEQFTINLRPAELGRIDIKLEIGQDGRVTASVAVEKAQTLELLQRDSRNLERALQDAGLKADSNSLNFSLRGEGGQSFQDSGRQGGSGRRGRGFGGGTGEVEDAQAAYTLTLAPGRVDIQA
ncbi:flagellar hook-length control protein FliK [Azospirillum brasilense]|uniref:flagellar hook-length control protein FliK n=1 Tax=Azospirillum brasilense TaxID=192 RepID=UPI001EDBB5CC|nr:flagellar hook-length control protein FliK [Azospirillum brasilense]UKJ72221.1 flagellar hook-length control protein FliK [Azospirillum brasilense]